MPPSSCVTHIPGFWLASSPLAWPCGGIFELFTFQHICSSHTAWGMVTLMVWPYFVWSWGISYGLMVFGKILWFRVKIAELNNFCILIMPRGCFYCLIYYLYLICPIKLTVRVWGLFEWRFRNVCIYYQIVTLLYTRHDNKSALFFCGSGLSEYSRPVRGSMVFRPC